MTPVPRASLSLAAALASAFLVTSPAAALDCGTRLVTAGDAMGYVRSVCGEPDSTFSRTESRTDFVAVPGRGQAVLGSAVTVSVQIDVWTYDFGRTRFMEEMTFANGVLRSSRALSYGTVAGDRRRRESLEGHGSLFGVPASFRMLAIVPTRRNALARG